ncbi:protein windbeutel [Contarinia nasturtii]|uniref:protein windbeutel n=1 Tax=Contarinia nasturtii TaxID=265458 RepID=UPI0012D39F04|nr:protein windbeutel [Contarinia nasturtii]
MSFNKVIAIFLISYPYFITGLVCTGCLELDELIFDKVLTKFSTVLVKFDIAFPYGKQHDEYAKFAKEISEHNFDNMIVSVVGIKNYGDLTNSILAERFSIDNQLPAIKLFSNGDSTKWTDFPRDQNITVENLRQFIRRMSDVKIVLPECLKQFDDYAKQFVDVIQFKSIEAEEIVNEATNEAAKLENEHEQKTAQIYLLFMRQILQKDIYFIGAERTRLQQILNGKISNEKRKEINHKLNILSAFHKPTDYTTHHNEL